LADRRLDASEVEQHHRHGVLLRAARIEEGQHEVVVDADGAEDDHRRDRRRQHRQDQAAEDLEVIGALDPRAVIHFGRDAARELDEDQDRDEVGARIEHHQRPARIGEAEEAQYLEGRNRRQDRRHGDERRIGAEDQPAAGELKRASTKAGIAL
jgi:hypothetical protein